MSIVIDYRHRCADCHGLVCQSCGACSGSHYWEGMTNWKGRVSTDKHGRTLCRECRYDKDEL